MPVRVVISEVHCDGLVPPPDPEEAQVERYMLTAGPQLPPAPRQHRLPSGFCYPTPPFLHDGKPFIRSPADGTLAVVRSLAIIELEVEGRPLFGTGPFEIGSSYGLVVEEARASNVAIVTPTGNRIAQRFRVRFLPAERYGFVSFTCRARERLRYRDDELVPGDSCLVHFCHEPDDVVYPPTVPVRPQAQQSLVPLVPGQLLAVYHGGGVGGCEPANDLTTLEYMGDMRVESARFRGTVFRQNAVATEDQYLIVNCPDGRPRVVTVPGLLWKASQYVPVLMDPLADSRVWCGNFRYVKFRFQEPTSVRSTSPDTIRVMDDTPRCDVAVRVVNGGWVEIGNRGGICTLSRR